MRPVLDRRRAGILLPVAALPGPHGVGDLGPEARRWIGWLGRAKQGIWQILPLHVVDAHGCPYASPTAFAREPLHLSLHDLADDGFLPHHSLPEPRPVGPVDWAAVRRERTPLLRSAAEQIVRRVDLGRFSRERPWVRTWALFAALQERHGSPWTSWPPALRDLPLDPARMRRVEERHPEWVLPHVALQWAFQRQWDRLRRLARAFDVEIWGDLPFFVGLDAADVWSSRHLFEVDPTGRPLALTGVPPDAFSKEGQLWGHPQLRIRAHRAEGWSWWSRRIRAAHALVDVLRIDHFRGLVGLWSIPAGAPSAAQGRWIAGPGDAPLREPLRRGARLVAEDLGTITGAVHALRDRLGLPGMKVLQFAFGPGGDAGSLPHNHRPDAVVYTGTHDNDTLVGWLEAAPPATRVHLRLYLGADDPAALRRAAWRSTARAAVLPLQDLLDLGSEARTNTPGTIEGNWRWRWGEGAFDPDLGRHLANEAVLSGRTGAWS